MTGDHCANDLADTTDTETREVVSAVDSDGNPVESVDMEVVMLEMIERAERVHEQMREEYADRDGVFLQGITKTDEKIDGRRIPAIWVVITPEANRRDLPDTIDRIPII